MNNIKQSIKILVLAIVLSFGLSYVYAWTAPAQTPPNGNVSAPINTSATGQVKIGGLTVDVATSTVFMDANDGTFFLNPNGDSVLQNIFAKGDVCISGTTKCLSGVGGSAVPTLSAVKIYNPANPGPWTKPANLGFIIIEVYGAGGSGGTGGSCMPTGAVGGPGGGSGGHAMKKINASNLPSTVTMTFGVGGASLANTFRAGNPGVGDTTFSTPSVTVLAHSGNGGSVGFCPPNSNLGGVGALAGSGGEYNLAGNLGSNGAIGSVAGVGGMAPVINPDGGAYGYPTSTAATDKMIVAAMSPKPGSGGAGGAPVPSKAGTDGAVIVYEYTN